MVTNRSAEELLLLFERADAINASLLKKSSDEVPIYYATRIARANNTQKERLEEEYKTEVEKMWSATRTLNLEKYESDYLSGKTQ